MWTTEEYAIMTLISVNRLIIKDKTPLPIIVEINIIKIKLLFQAMNLKYNRPNPPNFSIKPAKIIDPETGAST
jgi:hypothetical protein